MSARRIVAIAATGTLAVGGAGVAIAAASKDAPKKTEDAVLADAAKRLSVSPAKLRDALEAAQDAQLDKKLDEAVEDGKLTRKQADAIEKARERSGRVLGHVGPAHRRLFLPRGHRVAPGPGGPRFGLIADLAKALGISERELFTRLRKQESIADIAKDEGRSLAGVRSSLRDSARKRADKAVKDGDLTRKQADALLEHLDERLERLDRWPRHRFRGHAQRIHPPAGRLPGSLRTP